MLLVYGFIEEPRLLLHGGGGGQHTHVCPTVLTRELAKSQPGLLVAGMVALHENNKVQLEQADHVFKVCARRWEVTRSHLFVTWSMFTWSCVCMCVGTGLWELLAGGFLGGDAHGLLTGRRHSGTPVQTVVRLHRPADNHVLRYTLKPSAHTFKTQVAEKRRRSGKVAENDCCCLCS